jgi:cell wall-associated NlpC family hydrolase
MRSRPWVLLFPLFVPVHALCGCGGGTENGVPGGATSSPTDTAIGGSASTLPIGGGGGAGGTTQGAGGAGGAGTAGAGTGGEGTGGAGACTPATDVIIDEARSHLGAPYVWGAEGPDSFDCSGLVYAVFRDTGYFSIIGDGSARTVGQIAAVFADRGDEDTQNLEVGDLITFGNTDGYDPYQHIGIYEGQTNVNGESYAAGWVVNALNEQYGVVENKVDWLIPGVQTYLHTHLTDQPCQPVP